MKILRVTCAALLAVLAMILLVGCTQEQDETANVMPAGVPHSIMSEPDSDIEFDDLVQKIYENQPVGASGEVIAFRYRGTIYFNDEGILTVQVLAAAFDHEPSATAIAEMQDLGVIVRQVVFSEQQLRDALNAITRDFNAAMAAGGNSFGIGTDNTVIARLYPHNEEQIAIFTDFLLELDIPPAIISLHPAVSDEMVQRRYELVAAAMHAHHTQTNAVGHYGEIQLSRTGIAFQAYNPYEGTFYHSAQWDMAVYEDGAWRPMRHLVGRFATEWTLPLIMIPGGGQYNFGILHGSNWDWRFGELPLGRYAFIQDGWFGHGRYSTEGNTAGFIVVEFEITDDTPLQLTAD